jgi:hypothetical protein
MSPFMKGTLFGLIASRRVSALPVLAVCWSATAGESGRIASAVAAMPSLTTDMTPREFPRSW